MLYILHVYNPNLATVTVSLKEGDASTGFKFRIKQWYQDKCIGIDQRDGLRNTSDPASELKIIICDPNVDQVFSFTAHNRLMFLPTRECLRESQIGRYVWLDECDETSLTFNVTNLEYMELANSSITDNTTHCLTPHKGYYMMITPCDRTGKEMPSRMVFQEESDFQDSRKWLKLPMPKNRTNCDFPACGINQQTEPVKLLPEHEVERCVNLSDCVTVAIKSGRRAHLIPRFARSLRNIIGYDLPIVVVDDGIGPYDNETTARIAEFKNIEHIIGDDPDIGIGAGRTMAVRHVKTKYTFLLDDDSIAINETDIRKFVDILDTTDASLVGGRVGWHFAGWLKFTNQVNNRRALEVSLTCRRDNFTIPNFPECVNCEITTNVFIAKTKDLLECGGWTSELKIIEHKDLFIRMKAAGKKVAYCGNFRIINRKTRTKEYSVKRLRIGQMMGRFNRVWGIDRVSRMGQENCYRDFTDNISPEFKVKYNSSDDCFTDYLEVGEV